MQILPLSSLEFSLSYQEDLIRMNLLESLALMTYEWTLQAFQMHHQFSLIQFEILGELEYLILHPQKHE